MTSKRGSGAALALVLALSSPTGARAGGDAQGNVLLPMATPTIARSLYNSGTGPNGLTGYVIRFGRTVPAGTDYALTKTAGGPLVDLDVYFYRDIDDSMTCNSPRHEPDEDGGETGEFTCHARWAIVVLFTGADAGFEFDW